jgi:Uma2 family endonuclease
VATFGEAVRYPDALVTCTRGPGTDYLMPGVVVVFEVLSPSSGKIDRIDKLREYLAVPSIRRYVILESQSVGLSVFEREEGGQDWRAKPLIAEDTLVMPEIGIEVPVTEFYEEVDLPEEPTASDAAG